MDDTKKQVLAPEQKQEISPLQMLLDMISDRKTVQAAKRILERRLTILRDQVAKSSDRNQQLRKSSKVMSRELVFDSQTLESITKQKDAVKKLLDQAILERESIENKVAEAGKQLAVSQMMIKCMNSRYEYDHIPEPKKDIVAEANDKMMQESMPIFDHALKIVRELYEDKLVFSRDMFTVIETIGNIKLMREVLEATANENIILEQDLYRATVELDDTKKLKVLVYEETDSLDKRITETTIETNAYRNKLTKLEQQIAINTMKVEKLRYDSLRKSNKSILNDIDNINIPNVPELEGLRGILRRLIEEKDSEVSTDGVGQCLGTRKILKDITRAQEQ